MQEEYLDQSILAANQIQKSFVNNLKRKNRTVKQAGFIVLKYTYMPSVLIETGFLTNKTEGQYLNSKKGQREISNSIFKAIKKYKKAINFGVERNDNNENKRTIIQKVQIAAGKRKLDLKSYNFKGLSNLSRIKEGNLYKYFYSSSKNLVEIKKKKEFARKNGYSKAFIVGFENGKLFEVD